MILLLLSPAKSLDFETKSAITHFSQPDYLTQSAQLIAVLKTFSPQQVASLVKISDPLARLNFQRYRDWQPPFSPQNAKQAIFAFNGDVYEGLDANHLDEAALLFAQQQLRILSGLYGLLRPLDLMQAYRLEMGTRLATVYGKDLYAFWGKRLTEALNRLLAQDAQASAVINCASEEYFKVIQPSLLIKPVITPVFQDWKSGQYKVVSFYAKRARGLMARYMITHRLTQAEQLKHFAEEGYAFDESESDATHYVFRRKSV